MKKWLCLLLAGVLLFSLSACRREQNPTETTGAKQTDSTATTQTENTEAAQTENTNTSQPNNTEVTQPDNTEETKPDDKKDEENPYALREITDDRVKIENNQKIFNDNFFFSLTLPVNWKCLEQQGEDGRNHYFRDPILDEKCQLSIRLTGAEYYHERTLEQYRESLLSRPLQNLVIASITKETVQGYQCIKMVYSYTENGTEFIRVSYNGLIVQPRLYNISIIYPADQKDTYEPIFAAIINSVGLK